MAYDYNKGNEFIAYDNAMGNLSKTKQVVMLYDGIISFVQRAEEAFKKDDFQEQFNFLDDAAKIIVGLQASLDYDNGGEVASLLENYYIMMQVRVMNLIQDSAPEKYENVLKDLRKMKDSWIHVDNENTTSKSATAEEPVNKEIMEQVVEDASSAGISVSV